MYDIEVSRSPVDTAVRYTASVRVDHLSEDIGLRMDELYATVSATGLRPSGPPSINYPAHTVPGNRMVIELNAPVVRSRNGKAKTLDGARMRLLTTGGELRAHAIHHGPYTTLGKAHAALDDWLKNTHHHATGPHRETYLLGPAETTTPNDYLTDVSVAVTET